MADKRIDQLDAAGALAGTEPVPVYQDGATKQSTTGAIAGLVDLSGKQDAFTLGTGLSFVSNVLTLSTNLQGWSGLATSAKQDTLTAGTGIDITGSVISATGGGGGLTNWTEAVNTAAPNATVPAVSFTATNAATNVDAVLASKGNGARIASIPDNAPSGGNKRGTNAVDWQSQRISATQVASGANAVISGGNGNTAAGPQAVVGGGGSNSASGANATIPGGLSNTASSTQSTVGGGWTNQASGVLSTISGGFANQTTGERSWIPGGATASTRSIYGAYAWSSTIRGSVNGDNQFFGMTCQRETTNATPITLTADRSGTVTVNNVLTLPNNSSWAGYVIIHGRSTAGDAFYTRIDAVATRGANAASTAIAVQNPEYTFTAAVLAGVAATLVADTTRGALTAQVTGLAATTIDWFAIFHGAQIAR
jgi:hypothetical protein